MLIVKKCFGRPIDYILEYMEFMFNQQKSEDDQTVRTEHEEVPDIAIPPKFKVPNFNKYKGTTCPKNHLKVYYRKMRAYAKDEKLLIHFFQESLTGVAVTWYTNREPSRFNSWKDLMVAFIRQYQYNSDMAPDRTQL